MGEEASYANCCGDSLMLSILGAVIKRQGSPHAAWELSEAGDHRLPGLRRTFPVELGQQQEPALSLGETVEGRSAFSGYQTVPLPVPVASSVFNGFWPGVDRYTVGNLGFTDFSADALLLALLMCSPQAGNQFLPAFGLGMVDVLIDCLVADALTRVLHR